MGKETAVAGDTVICEVVMRRGDHVSGNDHGLDVHELPDSVG